MAIIPCLACICDFGTLRVCVVGGTGGQPPIRHHRSDGLGPLGHAKVSNAVPVCTSSKETGRRNLESATAVMTQSFCAKLARHRLGRTDACPAKFRALQESRSSGRRLITFMLLPCHMRQPAAEHATVLISFKPLDPVGLQLRRSDALAGVSCQLGSASASLRHSAIGYIWKSAK